MRLARDSSAADDLHGIVDARRMVKVRILRCVPSLYIYSLPRLIVNDPNAYVNHSCVLQYESMRKPSVDVSANSMHQ